MPIKVAGHFNDPNTGGLTVVIQGDTFADLSDDVEVRRQANAYAQSHVSGARITNSKLVCLDADGKPVNRFDTLKQAAECRYEKHVSFGASGNLFR